VKIPTSLKIGGHTYKVKIALDWRERADADGMCDNSSNTLFIYEKLSQSAKETTLIHEVLHAMNSTMSHESLDSLAEQLYQVLADNRMLK
jgi:hypothetical protein